MSFYDCRSPVSTDASGDDLVSTSSPSLLTAANTHATPSSTYFNSHKINEKSGVQPLRHRDLRRLEFQFNPLGEPIILVRRHAVLGKCSTIATT